MITFATRDMLPKLQAIWVQCFGDSSAYVEFLFRILQRPENMLVYLNSAGEPVSMLSFRPMALRMAAKEYPAAYVYAVATTPAEQGKGFGRRLLTEANLLLAEQGFRASVLVPANAGLFGFYKKSGYETGFHVRRACIAAELMPTAQLTCTLAPTTLEKSYTMRERFFGDSTLFVSWEKPYLKAVTKDCRYTGGEILNVSWPGGKGFAVCHWQNDVLKVKELAVPDSVVESALAALHLRYRAREYFLHLRADVQTPVENTLLPFGMVKWYDKEYKQRLALQTGRAAYMAHALD